MKNLYFEISDLLSSKSPFVLATVTSVKGSTPQKPGSSAIFIQDELLYGTVGGGVMEGQIQQISGNAIKSKESGYHHFKLDYDITHQAEAICGGQISVLVDATPVDHELLFLKIKDSLLDRLSGVLVTCISDKKDKGVLIRRYWEAENQPSSMPGNYFKLIETELKSLLSTGESGDYRELEKTIPGEENKIRFFLEPVIPPAHLVIAGAGHIGRALAHLGRLLDFEVTVIDDRIEYANPGNIPDADHIIVEDIGKAIGELKKTPNTYVVIVTRGHKDDASALKPCIDSKLAYVGMIGSKKKVALMQKSFIEQGLVSPVQWKEIHAPIGLDIQSQTVQEIAVSIAAELVLMKNSKRHSHA